MHADHGSLLLTGATGFVGQELLLRVLARSDRPVIAPVRAADDGDAAARMAAVLRVLGREEDAGRVTALAADLTTDGLGLGPRARDEIAAEVTTVVHGAASVRFDLPLADARRVNVEGTRAVLDLAATCRDLERFVHVSTAYVDGPPRNTYEQTKHEAEDVVRASGLPVQIVRPSIVVGDQHTGWTTSFNVIYQPLRAFSRGLLTAVPGDPHALVDAVPVDYVADGLWVLLGAESGGTHLLVAGDAAATLGDLALLACEHFGRDMPPFADDGALGDQLGPLAPYFSVTEAFSDPATEALLAGAGLEAPSLRDYLPTLLDFAERARWGKALPAERPRVSASAAGRDAASIPAGSASRSPSH